MIEPKHRSAGTPEWMVTRIDGWDIIEAEEVVFGEHWIRFLDEKGRLITAITAQGVLRVRARGPVDRAATLNESGSDTVTDKPTGRPADMGP